MPWCRQCSRYYTPPSVRPDGTCPHCGNEVEHAGNPAPLARPPWHFWLLVVAAAVYLGWRLVQGVGWLVQHL